MDERIDGRRLRYQHRRGDLLEAIAEYVLDNGVASLSLRRVGEAVGVSHVTIQHHFGSKDELVTEIVEHLLERTFAPRGDYAGVDSAGTMRALWSNWTHVSSALTASARRRSQVLPSLHQATSGI